jgi:hypothetical protein
MVLRVSVKGTQARRLGIDVSRWVGVGRLSAVRVSASRCGAIKDALHVGRDRVWEPATLSLLKPFYWQLA